MKQIGNERKGKVPYRRVTAWLIALVMVFTGLNVPTAVKTAEASTINRYVKDIKICSGADAFETLQALGDEWQIVNKNLNYGSYIDSQRIYMAYTTTNDVDEAITDLRLIRETDGIDSYLYKPVIDETTGTKANLNEGISGAASLSLYYTKNPSYGHPVRRIHVTNLSGSTSYTYSDALDGISLNEGWTMGTDIYMFVTQNYATEYEAENYSYVKELVADKVQLMSANFNKLIEGTDYTFSTEKGLEILSDKPMILYSVSGKSVEVSWPVTIAEGVSANLTIDKVDINRGTQGAAILVNVAEDDTATLNFRGSNELTAKGAYAAIQKNGAGKLVIQGAGSVKATAGATEAFAAAGIGGGSGVSEVSNIEIRGYLTVNAYGSTPTGAAYATRGGAGIGSQYNTPASDIVINVATSEYQYGSKVNAYGGVGAAGIGSGANASSANITISSGRVEGIGGGIESDGVGGAGIGSGAKLNKTITASNIQITGGNTYATGGYGAAGIGSGMQADADTITITDSGNVRTVTGGYGAAGIGSGMDGDAKNITSSGYVETITGGAGAAGIGSGMNGDASDITISGTHVVSNVKGGSLESDGGAGIGSGANGAVENISISTSAALKATGGTDAAGIGSGSSSTAKTAKNITIQSGSITATGTGNGAGIGGGENSSVTNLKITGGNVTAKASTANAAAIGACTGDVNNLQILTDSYVYTDATIGIGTGSQNTATNVTVIGDKIYGATSNANATFGTLKDSLYIIRNQYGFFGEASVLKDCDIEAGATATLGNDAKVIIPERVTLTVEENATSGAGTLKWDTDSNAALLIDGTLDVKGNMEMLSTNGTIILNGTMKLANATTIEGTFYNHGTLTGTIVKGDSQEAYAGEEDIAYMNLDIDAGVTYECNGTKVGDQVIITYYDYEDVNKGTYKISNIQAQDGYRISDIKLDGKSVKDKATEDNGVYTYEFNAAQYACSPDEDPVSFTFAVEAVADVEKLVIESTPDKLQYAKGDAMDLTGLVVSKVYMDGSKETLDLTKEATISGFDSNTEGAQTITIKYNGTDGHTDNVSTTFNVTVFTYYGINGEASYFTHDSEKIYPSSVDEDNHIITFTLTENIGNIDELASAIKIKPNGLVADATAATFEGCDEESIYPTKAEYAVTVYLDKAETVSVDYHIVITQPAYQIDLTDAEVAIAGEYTYFGKAICPDSAKISVTDEELTDIVDGNAVKDSYYTISYGENVNAGEGSVTITGDGVNATGSVTKTFTIAKATVTEDMLAATKEFTVINNGAKQIQLGVDEIVGLSEDEYAVSFGTPSNSAVVESFTNGLVTTKNASVGTATVVMTVDIAEDAANYNGGKIATTFTINVENYVGATALTISQDGTELEGTDGYYTTEMYAGNTLELTAAMQEGANDSISWESDNTAVATVKNGVINGVKAGEATITAKAGSGISKSVKVTVNEKIALTLSGTNAYTKTVGDDAFTLDVAVATEGVSQSDCSLSYQTSNAKVVTVDESGTVQVVGEGTATITATVTPEWDDIKKTYKAGTYQVTVTVKKAACQHKEVVDKAVAATCTTDGKTEGKHCSECKDVLVAQETVPATGHKLTKVEAVAATATTAGNMEYYVCETCQKCFADAAGTTEITKESTVIPAAQVAPAAKGTKLSDSTGASYKVTNADSKAAAVEYTAPKKAVKGTVKIPDVIVVDGVTYKVTSIASNAFKNNKKITKVTIGKNVTTIGKNAFSGCTKLKTLTIGANVTTISDKAFYKCTALTKITIPAKVKKIGKSAFEGCKKLKSVTIKTTKLTNKNVGAKAFKGIKSNATIKVPKSKLKAYKTLLVKKGVSKKAKFKKN